MELHEFAEQLLANYAELEYRGVRIAEGIAKSHNYNPKRNLIDQWMWDHIRSGIEAFLSLYQILEQYQVPLDPTELKLAMVAFALHDLHKEESLEKTGSSEYGLPLADLEKIGAILCQGLDVEVPPAEFLRVAGVSTFSNKFGDFSRLSSRHDWVNIYKWVKLMDSTASITCIAEVLSGKTVHNLRHLLVEVLPPKLTANLQMEYHYVQEMRGMTTTLLHEGMAKLMRGKEFYPWLRFGDGTLYLTFTPPDQIPKEWLIQELINLYFASMKEKADEVDEEALFDRSTFHCQTMAFMLNSRPRDFSQLFYRLFLKPSQGSKAFPDDKLEEKCKDYGFPDLTAMYQAMGVSSELTEDVREKWFYAARFFAALQRLTQRLTGYGGAESIRRLATELELEVEDILQTVPKTIQSNNRRYDEAIWLSYRYLLSLDFGGRDFRQVPGEDVRERLVEDAVKYLSGKVDEEKVRAIVDEETRIREELANYFQEQLVLSWELKREINRLSSKELLKKKSRTQKNICNLCNREILSGVEQKVKAPIIQDDVQVYSNRLLPKEDKVAVLHWCSICAFEHVLRQIFGMGIPGDKKYTRRIYLFAIPSFQLSEQTLETLYEELYDRFSYVQVHRRSKLNHVWQDPMLRGEKSFREHLRTHFRIYSEMLQEELAQRGRLPGTGDLLKASIPGNIMMFSFDCYSSSVERTREEAWMKALSIALSLNQLYGFRLVLTEKPYLVISDLREVSYAIHLDAPPMKIAELLPPAEVRQTTEFVVPIEAAKEMILRLAYLWEIHQTVHPFDYSKPTDKEISSVLHQWQVHPLPGAYFFKRYHTEYPYLTDSFILACQQIQSKQGGKWMGLAREIALASLELYRPSTKGDGRAHRYENLFRTICKGIKEGRDVSELQGLLMKRLERIPKEAGYVPKPVSIEAVQKLVELVYVKFFKEQCHGNLAKLNQRENQMADGIYFETHLEMQKFFAEKKEEVKDESYA